MSGGRPSSVVSPDLSTRDQIIASALDLFFEQGLQGSSMRDIAGRIGIAQSSLYNHFPTRDALVMAVMERNFEALDLPAAELFENSTPSLDLMRRALRAHALINATSIKEAQVFDSESRWMPAAVRDRIVESRDRYEGRFQQLAEWLAERGLITKEHTRLKVRMLIASGVAIGRWFHVGGSLTADDVADIYAEIGLASLGAKV